MMGNICVLTNVGERLQQIRYVMAPGELTDEEDERILSTHIPPPSVVQEDAVVNWTKCFAGCEIGHGNFLRRYAVNVDQPFLHCMRAGGHLACSMSAIVVKRFIRLRPQPFVTAESIFRWTKVGDEAFSGVTKWHRVRRTKQDVNLLDLCSQKPPLPYGVR